MKRYSPHEQVTNAVREGWVAAGGFFGAIMAGFLLGYLADLWLGTDPWLVVSGIIAGSATGFYGMMQLARRAEEEHLGR